METRSEILGLLTELITEDVSLEDLKSGRTAIEAYRGMLENGSSEEEELDDILPDIIEEFYSKQEDLISQEELKVQR
ncbi:MAG: hypothetical protein HKN79_08600, partial [Flavobacteriales bacterium]|nr:hypothetical protein [Flavobacteriales bacterium]